MCNQTSRVNINTYECLIPAQPSLAQTRKEKMLSNEVSSEDSIASRSGVDEVVSTAGRLAAIYINELLEKPSSIEDPTPSFTRKFTQLVREVERRHVAKYDDMCNSLVINGRTVYIVFSQVSDELFKNGVNWGRVLGLYAFAGALCRACIEKGMSPSMDEEIRKWVVAYIRSNLATWMTDHGGWVC